MVELLWNLMLLSICNLLPICGYILDN